MRDIHQLSDKKVYIEPSRELIDVVREIYPNAMKQGSLGSWSFYDQEELVGEAWLHRTKPGWWLRVKARG